MTYRYLNLSRTTPDRTPVKIDRWYDRSVRVWTAFPVNAAGDQIGDAQHAHRKTDLTLKLADYTIWED